MRDIKQLLFKYDIIDKISITRSELVLHITDTAKFNQILEKCAINVIEIKEATHETYETANHRFGVSVVFIGGFSSNVHIPFSVHHVVINNLLSYVI